MLLAVASTQLVTGTRLFHKTRRCVKCVCQLNADIERGDMSRVVSTEILGIRMILVVSG